MTLRSLPLIIAAGAAVASCTSVSAPIPDNRFVGPEAGGKLWGGRAGASYGSTTNVKLVADAGAVPPRTDAPKLTPDNDLDLDAMLSVHSRVDLIYGAAGFGAKVQLLGDPADVAKAGNMPLAVELAVGSVTDSQSSESTILGKTTKVSTNAKARWYDAAVIGGYRTSSEVLLYVGAGIRPFSASGSLKQTASDGAATSYSIPEGHGRVTTLHGGFEFGSAHFYVMLEPGYVISTYDGAADYSRPVLGGTLGYKW